MSVQLPRYRTRLKADCLHHGSLTCLLQGAVPRIWRGVDWQVEVALFLGDTFTDDISNIDYVVAELHDASDRDGAPLVQKTVAAVDLNTTLTEEEWDGGAADDAHAVFAFEDGDTQLDMTDAIDNVVNFWLVIHAVTTDGYRTTYAGGVMEVEEDGAQNGLATVTSAVPTVVLYDGDLYLYNPDTALYHKAQATGAAGAVTLALEQTGVTYASIT